MQSCSYARRWSVALVPFLVTIVACNSDDAAPSSPQPMAAAGMSGVTGNAGAAPAAGNPARPATPPAMPLAGAPAPPLGAAGQGGSAPPVSGRPGSTAGAPAAIGGSGGLPALAGSGGAAGMPALAGAGGGAAPGSMLPPIDDYSKNGPFSPLTAQNTGPDGQYTMVRPSDLGKDGFKHPIATWGNGITTTPALYPGLLDAIASHGFVIIASNSSTVTASMLTSGLDWLIEQNTAAGELQGKLDIERAVTIGYSLGGGAAVDAGKHPAVIATVSWHGLQGGSESLHGPLLLITSTHDGFVTKEGYVKPCYDRSSKVPTVMATLDVDEAPSFNGHLYPLGDAGDERAPAIAWLRLWVYGDTGGRKYFYGADCLLCKDGWTDIQRKNGDWN
jgi:hypothetical protein